MAQIDHPEAEVTWRDDTIPVSTRFDDPYYSLEDGLAETRHTFLAGNDLPARFVDGFHVAELGFGTGLNLLATLRAWRDSGTEGRLHYTSFEAYPMSAETASKALAAFPQLASEAAEIMPIWNTPIPKRNSPMPIENTWALDLPDLTLRVIVGDARATVPAWDGQADAWFLDGFSPAKNPELWEPALMQAVATQTKQQGTCATYTAAGAVRRALTDAGFTVERTPGYGRKRHMTRGYL